MFNRDIVLLRTSYIGGKIDFGANTIIYVAILHFMTLCAEMENINLFITADFLIKSFT